MAEKKTATKKVATKATEAKPATKATAKAATKTTATKAASKKAAVAASEYINAESVGFRAGDVYQALASAEKSMTVAEIAKAANITTNEVLLGLGWLFKEGKVKGENIADLSLA